MNIPGLNGRVDVQTGAGVIGAIIAVIALILGLGSSEGSSANTAADSPTTTATQTPSTTVTQTPAPQVPADALVLGKPIAFDNFTITVQSIEMTEDFRGDPALKITYDWTNTSDKTTRPFITFGFKAFQNGVETDGPLAVKGVDFGTGQREVQPGATITGAERAVGISDINAPLELHLVEYVVLRPDTYKMVIQDLNAL